MTNVLKRYNGKCKSICDLERFLEWYCAAKVGIFVTCDNFLEKCNGKMQIHM